MSMIPVERNKIKNSLFEKGVFLSKKFLKVNNIPYPVFNSKYSGHGSSKQGMLTGLYEYRTKTVHVNIPKTALPVQKPGHMAWSYPGWKTDRTATGVVAHEVGHHIEAMLVDVKLVESHFHKWKMVITSNKKKVSGYEPVAQEAWAETMRLFILNPTLLKYSLPERYEYITKVVGLRPSESRRWRNVLNKHPVYCSQGMKWINK